MKEIAIFGGAFDPPTLAHEAIIEACLNRDDIDEVWLMPSGVRKDKPGMGSDDSRMAMLGILQKQRFEGQTKLKISDFELCLPRPTQTTSTVQALKTAHPDQVFWFVFGADSIETMPTWRGGEALRRTLGILAVPRVGHQLPAETSRLRHLKVDDVIYNDLSSTKVRQALAEGMPIEGMVSRPIANYLR